MLQGEGWTDSIGSSESGALAKATINVNTYLGLGDESNILSGSKIDCATLLDRENSGNPLGPAEKIYFSQMLGPGESASADNIVGNQDIFVHVHVSLRCEVATDMALSYLWVTVAVPCERLDLTPWPVVEMFPGFYRALFKK